MVNNNKAFFQPSLQNMAPLTQDQLLEAAKLESFANYNKNGNQRGPMSAYFQRPIQRQVMNSYQDPMFRGVSNPQMSVEQIQAMAGQMNANPMFVQEMYGSLLPDNPDDEDMNDAVKELRKIGKKGGDRANVKHVRPMVPKMSERTRDSGAMRAILPDNFRPFKYDESYGEDDEDRFDSSYGENDEDRFDSSYDEDDEDRFDSSYGENDEDRFDSSYDEDDEDHFDSSYDEDDEDRFDWSYGEDDEDRFGSSYDDDDDNRFYDEDNDNSDDRVYDEDGEDNDSSFDDDQDISYQADSKNSDYDNSFVFPMRPSLNVPGYPNAQVRYNAPNGVYLPASYLQQRAVEAMRSGQVTPISSFGGMSPASVFGNGIPLSYNGVQYKATPYNVGGLSVGEGFAATNALRNANAVNAAAARVNEGAAPSVGVRYDINPTGAGQLSVPEGQQAIEAMARANAVQNHVDRFNDESESGVKYEINPTGTGELSVQEGRNAIAAMSRANAAQRQVERFNDESESGVKYDINPTGVNELTVEEGRNAIDAIRTAHMIDQRVAMHNDDFHPYSTFNLGVRAPTPLTSFYDYSEEKDTDNIMDDDNATNGRSGSRSLRNVGRGGRRSRAGRKSSRL
eukprot:Nk52_evm15s2309 gene=Nk52_evmTU15s2309